MGFSDNEIDVALAGNFEENVRPKRKTFMKKKNAINSTGKEDEENCVDRQILNENEEEICPICQDDMKKEHALTWCRKGCGNNIHAKCMKMYAQYKATTKKDILCPLCRENWGPMAIHIIYDDCKGKASLKKACANVTCTSCAFHIRGNFYRCVECSMYGSSSNCQSKNGSMDIRQNGGKPVDFCKTCFYNIGRGHSKHHFLTSSTNSTVRDFAWEYVKNPRAPHQLLDVDILENIQNRELTTEDYDLLLGLDKPQTVTIQDTILNAMHGCKSDLLQCWCGTNVASDTAKSLVCGHAAHIECCREKLNEAIEEGFFQLEEIKCSHADCECPLFEGLGRRRKKNVQSNLNPNASVVCDHVKACPFDFMIAGAGISAAATGVATPLYNERSELSLDLSSDSTMDRSITLNRLSVPVPVQSRGVLEEGADKTMRNAPMLVIQSGKLPPRHVSRFNSKGSCIKPSRRKGLSLCGHGQGIQGTDIIGSGSSANNANALHFTQGHFDGNIPITSAMRSTSAPSARVAVSRGTSSFALAKTKRRDSVKNEHMQDQTTPDVELSRDMLQVTSSSGLLLQPDRCGQEGSAISIVPPIGMVQRQKPSRSSHVARIRGLTTTSVAKLTSGLQSSQDKSIQMCLNVNHY